VATRENEWQFDALDLNSVRRWLDDAAARVGSSTLQVSPLGSTRQVDLYLDTEDQRFHRAGYSLRVRRVNRRRLAEATLKSLDPVATAAGSTRSRREISQPVERSDTTSLALADGPVIDRVRAVAGRRPLLHLFEVRTHRQVFSVSTNDHGSGEIAVDETRILPAPGAPPTRLSRVELKVPDGTAAAFEPLAEQLRVECALRPADLSKYEAGLISTGLPTPQGTSFGPTDFDENATIGTVAVASLRRQLSALLDEEPGTRLGEDPERLHDMRVASRRLRAALSLFSEVLPPGVVAFRTELRWIGGVLGAVRDLDVQLQQLDEWRSSLPEADRSALDGLDALVEERRAEARETLLEALDSGRYESFVNRFGRALRARPPRNSALWSSPALNVAPALIEARFRAVRRAADRLGQASQARDYHRLRIHGKRLRYALEFFADLYPKQTLALSKRLAALQDILGLHQDADVAIARLRALVDAHADRLEPATVFAMGQIAERYRQSMRGLQAQVPPAAARVRGKAWRSLKKTIEGHSADADADAPASGPTAVDVSDNGSQA
jgi:CHAD domain-containing protein